MMNDIEILSQLEKESGLSLTKRLLEEIMYYYSGAGYTLDENEHIIGLNLSYLKTGQLPAPLSKLSNLRELLISNTPCTDFSQLKELTYLTALAIRFSKIDDFAFLHGLHCLTKLDLLSDQVADISFLEGMTELTELDLSDNAIGDYTYLGRLPNLTRLNLSSSRIQDISFLKGMTNLTSLNLNKNQIMDISVLRGMRHLKELHLMENRVVDISPLQGLTSLTGINLIDNRVKELPAAFLNLGMEINVTMRIGLVQRIDMAGNPLEKPPLEIIKKGKEAMRAYFANPGAFFLYGFPRIREKFSGS